MGPPQMLQSHSLWSATSLEPVVLPVGHNRSAKGMCLVYDCHGPSHVDHSPSATSHQPSYDKSLLIPPIGTWSPTAKDHQNLMQTTENDWKPSYGSCQPIVWQSSTDKRLEKTSLWPTGHGEVFGACIKYLAMTKSSQSGPTPVTGQQFTVQRSARPSHDGWEPQQDYQRLSRI